MKVVINKCYGGFSVSENFLKHYNIPLNQLYSISRYDERLIEYIEVYGCVAASGKFAHLVVEDIPSGSYYRINEYDGYESIQYREEIEWLIAE